MSSTVVTPEPFGLLEFGSNSLKFYLVRLEAGGRPTIKTHKRPWRVAHAFFTEGRLDEDANRELIATLCSMESVSEGLRLSSMLAVATGVFRELPDLGALAARVRAETGVRLRVISGEDEAKLMARSFLLAGRGGAFLLCDLGGATLEWAFIEQGTQLKCGSLPLGAIRNEHLFRRLRGNPESYLRESALFCDSRLAVLPAVPGTAILATGGTARALNSCLGTSRIALVDLQALIRQVAREGAPASLKPERREVFLPGLVILERLLLRLGSDSMESAPISVRDGMACRLIQLLGSRARADLHSTLLLHTRFQ
jgi:exopolyphosphatase / guanosine-5'-triphosphate,3'-diphosphate pyrophosphatase